MESVSWFKMNTATEKLLAHLRSSNDNMTLSCGVMIFSHWVNLKTRIPCPVDRDDAVPLIENKLVITGCPKETGVYKWMCTFIGPLDNLSTT